jgi:hypothetical protein
VSVTTVLKTTVGKDGALVEAEKTLQFVSHLKDNPLFDVMVSATIAHL